MEGRDLGRFVSPHVSMARVLARDGEKGREGRGKELTRSATLSYALQKYKLLSCICPPATIYSTAGSRTWPTEKSIELEEPESGEMEPKSWEKANTGLEGCGCDQWHSVAIRLKEKEGIVYS